MKARSRPKLRSAYRILPGKGDRRVSLTLSPEVNEDLQALADFNKRSFKEELLARVRATLLHNDLFMQQDHLMLMIFNKKLAVPDLKKPSY